MAEKENIVRFLISRLTVGGGSYGELNKLIESVGYNLLDVFQWYFGARGDDWIIKDAFVGFSKDDFTGLTYLWTFKGGKGSKNTEKLLHTTDRVLDICSWVVENFDNTMKEVLGEEWKPKVFADLKRKGFNVSLLDLCISDNEHSLVFGYMVGDRQYDCKWLEKSILDGTVMGHYGFLSYTFMFVFKMRKSEKGDL